MRLATLLLALLLAACARPVPPGTVELLYATPYAPTHPFSRADQTWMDFVEQRSGGTLRVRPIWSGGLLSSDMSMEELRHGVADVGLVTPIYVRGGTHLIRIQSGFYSGANTMPAQLALYQCIADAHPQIGREIEGLKVLALQGGSLPGIVTVSRPIRTLDDLKGLRLRAPTELLTVLETLGADPVNMPMADVYSAMARGVIDGVVAPPDTFSALHFAEVADHYSAMDIPRGAYPARAMNMKRWDQLSEEHKAVLEGSIAVWEAALADEIDKAAIAGLDRATEEGVIMNAISPEEQARFDRLYLQDAERNARSLEKLGINGLAAFRTARASVVAPDTISCRSS